MMRFFFLAFGLIMIQCASTAQLPKSNTNGLVPGRNEVSITQEGRQRTAVVFIPRAKAAPAKGYPVVMMLHGAGGSTKNVIEATGWNQVGEREGFITIFPNGTPKNEKKPESFRKNPQTWNSGAGSSLAAGGESAIAKNVDDVGFLAKLIEYVKQNASVDPARIYVCGHSNGAGMAYRFAFERSDLVAAVGVMAGHFFQNGDKMEHPVSLLQIVGDKDPFTPMDGGKAGIGRSRMDVPPALDSPERWAKLLGITNEAVIIKDNNNITERQWGPNACSAEVKSIVVKGQGHAYMWPGGNRLPQFLIGPALNTLNATEEFWAFFKAHSRIDKC